MGQAQKENIIQTLENYHDAALRREDVWDFFLSISDYVSFIKRTPQLEQLTGKLFGQKNVLFSKVEKYEKKTRKELESAEKKLLKIAKDNNPSSHALDRALKNLDLFKKGLVQQAGIPTDHLNSYLFNIAKEIKRGSANNLVASFEDPNRKPQNIYGNFVFSKSICLRDEAIKELEQQREIELWGCWDHLSLIEKDLFLWQDWRRQFHLVDQQLIHEWVELKDMLKERKDSPANMGHLAIRDDNAEFQRSKRDRYSQYISRIHIHILEELRRADGPDSIGQSKSVIEKESNLRPIVSNDGKNGFIQLHNRGEKILLGSIETRKYRLIATLTDPVNAAKSVEYVFSSIGLQRDEKDPDLRNAHRAPGRMTDIIKDTTKELQRLPKLKGKLRLTFAGHNNKEVRMEIRL